MSGFNLQIGMDSDSTDAGTLDAECSKCEETTTHNRTMKTTRLRLFGIPLGKGKTSTTEKCSVCGNKRDAD